LSLENLHSSSSALYTRFCNAGLVKFVHIINYILLNPQKHIISIVLPWKCVCRWLTQDVIMLLLCLFVWLHPNISLLLYST